MADGTKYDLLVVTDATGSMDRFLAALNTSLPELIAMSTVTASFERIGVLAYRDYSDGAGLIEWLGWYSIGEPIAPADAPGAESIPTDANPADAARADATGSDAVTQAQLLERTRKLSAHGGGDWPEATRTALAKAYEVMRPDAETVILIFADAPPHSKEYGGENRDRELAALGDRGSYGGYGPLFAKWTSACDTLATGGPAGKKARVYSVIGSNRRHNFEPYLHLSEATGGVCLEPLAFQSLSGLTISILLSWMGISKADTNSTESGQPGVARVFRYRDQDRSSSSKRATSSSSNRSIEAVALILSSLHRALPAGRDPVCDFGQRYLNDEAYRTLVQDQLRSIIRTNVVALTINPIFGTLWRAVAAFRSTDARDELIALFSGEVGKLDDEQKRERLTIWLEESYDYAADIAGYIDAVPEEQRFPCVFLDPTQDFSTNVMDDANGDGDEDKRPLNEFTRKELLEVARSCDASVLRRLGKVLTRLTFVQRAEELPAHIHDAGMENVPRLPLALAHPTHKRRLWRMLLHLIKPGTLLSPRGAALLAALSLRMGIRPLCDAADTELLLQRDEWNNLNVAETWNAGCLRLLLDADADFQRRVAAHDTPRPNGTASSLLRPNDRQLFRALVNYKALERNMRTTLMASVGWTPDKTQVPIGPLVVCRVCRFPRSVTIMAPKSVCGLCTFDPKCPNRSCNVPTQEDRLRNRVALDHDSSTPATWVECAVRTCRAQYVVYNPDDLVRKPKCYDCRHRQSGEPNWLECSECRNRVIYPVEYRHRLSTSALESWKCYACTGGVVTIIDTETDAATLRAENGNDWLIKNADKLGKVLFDGKSLYRTATAVGLTTFENIRALPDLDTVNLTLRGHPIHNPRAVIDTLRRWISSGHAEQGACSLCFAPMRKDALVRACGRRGCTQQICTTCRRGWYGLNGPGRVINVAALHCPFCRRPPAARAVAESGLARLGNPAQAVHDASWVYAWCTSCSSTKRHAERECVNGAPRIEGWQCEECVEAAVVRLTTEVQNRLLVVHKSCPGCGVETQKTGGCDHIECPCGTHWCYGCGKLETKETIYGHISSEHGGVMVDGDDDDDEEEEDDDDDWGLGDGRFD